MKTWSSLYVSFLLFSFLFLSAEDTVTQIIKLLKVSPQSFKTQGCSQRGSSIFQASLLPLLSRSRSLLPHSSLQADSQTTSLVIPNRLHHSPQQKLHSTTTWKEEDEQSRSAHSAGQISKCLSHELLLQKLLHSRADWKIGICHKTALKIQQI